VKQGREAAAVDNVSIGRITVGEYKGIVCRTTRKNTKLPNGGQKVRKRRAPTILVNSEERVEGGN